MSAAPQPLELRVRREPPRLEVDFDDGSQAVLPAEYLRVESPSAEVQGHGPGERKIVLEKAAVRIDGAEPVGRYAVRLRFSDGHDTGIFTWAYLHELSQDHDRRWAAYLEALAAKGLRRDAPIPRAREPRPTG